MSKGISGEREQGQQERAQNLVGEAQVGPVGREWMGLRGKQGPVGGLCLSPWTLGVASVGHRDH